MSAAARGAAGAIALRRGRAPRALQPGEGEVEALARQLVKAYNISEASALALAKEQAAKRFFGKKRR